MESDSLQALPKGDLSKIKTPFAKIIICGTKDKPYYNIMYLDMSDDNYHIGFGSYNIDYVWYWLSNNFEIQESDAP